MYVYKSQIGIMKIGFDRNVGKYALVIKNIIYGHYDNPIAAADDVYSHVTGCDEWDDLDGEIDDVPTDIYEWARIN